MSEIYMSSRCIGLSAIYIPYSWLYIDQATSPSSKIAIKKVSKKALLLKPVPITPPKPNRVKANNPITMTKCEFG
jgi:hypothetical protein